ncbi:MAG: FAD-dependent oxidoreductase [Planctomycetes bacterium]|nr:FAD-dependent oxidoreductase [Planctomycetota bacterium]
MNAPGSPPSIAVVGSGVIGLSAALRLCEAGCKVTVLARERPPQTTSNVAAAYWSPGCTEGPQHKWSLETLRVLEKLAAQHPAFLSPRRFWKLFKRPVADPSLGEGMSRIQRLPQGQLPEGIGDAWGCDTYVIHADRYLAWLTAQLETQGVRFETRELRALSEVPPGFAAIVNASGLGARELVPDAGMYAIRGQVVRVELPGALPLCILNHHEDDVATYVVPRQDDCILGGTYLYREEQRAADEATTAAILERCQRLAPQLQGARILEVKVGLRPGRDAVRLGCERMRDGRPVVHAYGHGPVGFTLSWGCASQVKRLVLETQGMAGTLQA